jgi:hypothetical protein
MKSCPGDPEDDRYSDTVPPMIAPTISFMGPVTYHHENINQRLFGIDLSVYKKKVDNQQQYQSFLVLCHFPDNPRWQSFKLPYLNRPLFITGDIIGLYTVNGHRSICISIAGLTYLPVPTTTQPSSKELLRTPTSTSSPSRKRLRRMGEPPTPQTSSSTTLADNSKGKESIRQSSPEWQLFEDLEDKGSDPDLPTQDILLVGTHDRVLNNDVNERLTPTPSPKKTRRSAK